MRRPRVLVVDDEAPARSRIQQLLRAETEWNVVGEAHDVATAVSQIESLDPDVVFLDIRMPGGDGFEVVRRVGPNRMPPVIFVTAFDDRAVEAFEIGARDYLVKPLTRARFRIAVERLRERLESPNPAALVRELEILVERTTPAADFLDRITVWSQDRGTLVPVERIDHIGAARARVWVHVKGKKYLVRHSIGELEGRLDPSRFKRIHRSHIVNLDAIRELQLWFHGDMKVLMRDGTELMWSRRYRAREQDPRLLE